MRKPHRKQLLAWLLTAALLLVNLPVSVLSEEIIENPIQTEIVEQNEPETVEEPNPSDFPTEETGEPTEPPVSEEPNETPEPSEPSGIMEIPADENTPDIPDQDESETPESSDSDIEATPSPEVPEETPDTDSTDEPPVEETPIPEENPLPDDEEAFSVSEAILEYGYAYAAAYTESVIYEDTALTAPLFTLKEDGGVLLITEETETAFKVWWLTYADEPLSGYPYMIVDTGYEDSDVWSRVAGQFAIREVVKQLEGDWYVRDYWRMDEFYRASGQAPADYLEYARWLASCAIRRSVFSSGDVEF